jgi:predicted permease
MRSLTKFILRLRSLFRGESVERELSDELRFHIEQQVAQHQAAGMTLREARGAALAELGGIEQIKEECRDTRGVNFISSFVQDVKYGLRMLGKSPVFTTVAVLTLALGIGPNTAIFGLIDAVVLRSLPVENPSELMLVEWTAHHAPNTDGYWSQGACAIDSGNGTSGCSFSEPMFRQIERSDAFAGATAFAGAGQLNLTGNGPATLVNGQFVSGDFFQTTGVKAAYGRAILPSDDSASATPVAVLSYGYWQRAFGGNRDVIGRTIELNRASFTIIGVADQRFRGLSPGSVYDVWLPLSDGELISTADMPWNNRQADATFWWLTVIGRLKSGTQSTLTQAQLSVLFRNETLHGPLPLFQNGESNTPPASGSKWGSVPSATQEARADDNGSMHSTSTGDPEIILVSAKAGLTGQRGRYSDSLYVLMLAVGIILLIACANVAGLSLARANARKNEIAVRLTLGASRARILRQLLTESVLLSVLGGVLGILFAYWGTHAIVSFVSSNQAQPLGFVAGIDIQVLGFTFGVSLLTGILFGIAPALRSIRADLAPSLKDGGRSARNSGDPAGKWFSVSNGLVVGQVALAVVLLIGAGLLVRTLSNLRNVDVGFDPRNVVIFKADPALAGYGAAEARSLYIDVQHRLAAIPGVKAVSYSFAPPLTGGAMAVALHWPGTAKDQQSIVDMLPVGPEFFGTLRIPLFSGRSFREGDFERSAANGRDSPTSVPTPVIVNQAFVRQFLQNEDPLGKRFGESEADTNGPANPGYEIIGVVRDAKYSNLRRGIQPAMYGPQSHGNAWFELRTAANPRALLPAIRDAISQVSPNLPLFDVRTLSEQADRLLFQERLMAWLSELLGLLALMVAAVGLYGLLSFEVSRRTHEIGVRMALGAEAGSVVRLVAGRGTLLAVVGAGIGVAVALGATRAIAGVLYGVGGNDPETFVAVSVLLMLVALAACWFPARRATQTDPMQALRYE